MQTGYTDKRFCACDLELDPMTFIHEPDLHISQIYMRTKYGRSRSRRLQYLETKQNTRRICFFAPVTLTLTNDLDMQK